MVKKIGITGSVGVGKSTLSHFFFKLGYPVISSDKHAHKALLKDSPVRSSLLQILNIQDDKPWTRSMIAQKIFFNPKLKKKFEDVIHPFILKSILKEEQEFIKKNCKIIFYEVPLLFETHLEKFFHFIILVICNANLQKQRLMKKGYKDQKLIEQIIRSQQDPKKNIRRVDMVIKNESNLDHLRHSAHNILKKLSLEKKTSCSM